jgi:TRAP-type C4-dicarboxylate transport system substrate-binding protein
MKRKAAGFLGKGRGVVFILLVSCPIIFGVTFAYAANFPKMDVKLGHSGVVDMSYHKGSVKFAELMKERTGGAITVHVFPANQLGSEKDMVEQVKNGVIHISLTGPSMLAQFKGWGPIGVLGMPYVLKGDTEDELRPKLIKLARGPLMNDLNERAGVKRRGR